MPFHAHFSWHVPPNRVVFGVKVGRWLRRLDHFGVFFRGVKVGNLEPSTFNGIIHLAAIVGFPACQAVGRQVARRYNVEATQRVFEAAEAAGVERVVFAFHLFSLRTRPRKSGYSGGAMSVGPGRSAGRLNETTTGRMSTRLWDSEARWNLKTGTGNRRVRPRPVSGARARFAVCRGLNLHSFSVQVV